MVTGEPDRIRLRTVLTGTTNSRAMVGSGSSRSTRKVRLGLALGSSSSRRRRFRGVRPVRSRTSSSVRAVPVVVRGRRDLGHVVARPLGAPATVPQRAHGDSPRVVQEMWTRRETARPSRRSRSSPPALRLRSRLRRARPRPARRRRSTARQGTANGRALRDRRRPPPRQRQHGNWGSHPRRGRRQGPAAAFRVAREGQRTRHSHTTVSRGGRPRDRSRPRGET